jgi:class 3 adenylate cyclase
MEPRIQYAKTSDGVHIAYTAWGRGDPPLISLPILLDSHLQLQGEDPEVRQFDSLLAERRMVVKYDSRGTGLSDRNATDYSLDTLQLDLEAVMEALKLESAALFGAVWTGPVAISYAVAHPERVSHLILFHTWAKTRDTVSPSIVGLARLLETDWDMYTETVARWSTGWSEGEMIRRVVARYRASVSQEAWRTFGRAMRDVDTSEILGSVRCPTLVVQRRNSRISGVDVARKLTAAIPGAQLALMEGDSPAPFINPGTLVDTIGEFLGDVPSDRKVAKFEPAGTAIILFADIADSTALTERLGDAAFREKARELDEALRRAITSNGGTAIDGKLLGDGVLATFGAAREAIACAQELHRLAAGSGGAEPSDQRIATSDLLLHVGIHAGDVIRESNNVYGGAVNIAARISGEAAAGETLVSATVRDLARTSAGVSFEDRGERELNGVSEPVRVFAVRSEA